MNAFWLSMYGFLEDFTATKYECFLVVNVWISRRLYCKCDRYGNRDNRGNFNSSLKIVQSREQQLISIVSSTLLHTPIT